MKNLLLSAVTLSLLLSACGTGGQQTISTPEAAVNSPAPAAVDPKITAVPGLGEFLQQTADLSSASLSSLGMNKDSIEERGDVGFGFKQLPRKAFKYEGGFIDVELIVPDKAKVGLFLIGLNDKKEFVLIAADDIVDEADQVAGQGNDENAPDPETEGVLSLQAKVEPGTYSFVLANFSAEKVPYEFWADFDDDQDDEGSEGEQNGPWLINVLKDADFPAVLERSKKDLVILDFGKTGCAPCEVLKPLIEEKNAADAKSQTPWVLASTFNIAKFDDIKGIWEKYKNPWFPTLIAIKNEQEVARYIGFDKGQERQLETWLDDLRAGKTPANETLISEQTVDNLEQVNVTSQRHPVLLEFYDAQVKDSQVHKDTEAYINKAAGKLTLVRVDKTKYPALAKQFKAGTAGQVNLVAIYRADEVFRQDGEKTTEETTDFLMKITNTAYPPK